MFRNYQDHFEWRGQALLQGRYDDLALHYRTPFLADLAGHIVPIDTPEDWCCRCTGTAWRCRRWA